MAMWARFTPQTCYLIPTDVEGWLDWQAGVKNMGDSDLSTLYHRETHSEGVGVGSVHIVNGNAGISYGVLLYWVGSASSRTCVVRGFVEDKARPRRERLSGRPPTPSRENSQC